MNVVVFSLSFSVLLVIDVALAQKSLPLWLQQDSFGQICGTTADCGGRARCVNNVCACRSTDIAIRNGTCLPRIKPGQTPCWVDEQCQAIWPETHCANTICQCTRGIPVRTRDGIVCIKYQQCPLGGKAAVLRDEQGKIAECTLGSNNGFMTGCLNQLHMYNCVRDSSTELRTFYCCPNMANTCSQPKDIGVSGAGSPRLRWYFESIKRTCLSFSFLGEGGNANNFQTKQHCESFCRDSCARGSPAFDNGVDNFRQQFVQRVLSCDPGSPRCGSQFSCDVMYPGKALCCPTRDFVCGRNGAIVQRPSDSYDEGINCADRARSRTRYYYDESLGSCITFEYKGCSGNFNNFVTKRDCESFCIFDRTKFNSTVNYLFERTLPITSSNLIENLGLARPNPRPPRPYVRIVDGLSKSNQTSERLLLENSNYNYTIVKPWYISG